MTEDEGASALGKDPNTVDASTEENQRENSILRDLFMAQLMVDMFSNSRPRVDQTARNLKHLLMNIITFKSV